MEHYRLELSFNELAQPIGFSLITYDEHHEPVEYIVWPSPPAEHFAHALTEAFKVVRRQMPEWEAESWSSFP